MTDEHTKLPVRIPQLLPARQNPGPLTRMALQIRGHMEQARRNEDDTLEATVTVYEGLLAEKDEVLMASAARYEAMVSGLEDQIADLERQLGTRDRVAARLASTLSPRTQGEYPEEILRLIARDGTVAGTWYRSAKDGVSQFLTEERFREAAFNAVSARRYKSSETFAAAVERIIAKVGLQFGDADRETARQLYSEVKTGDKNSSDQNDPPYQVGHSSVLAGAASLALAASDTVERPLDAQDREYETSDAAEAPASEQQDSIELRGIGPREYLPHTGERGTEFDFRALIFENSRLALQHYVDTPARQTINTSHSRDDFTRDILRATLHGLRAPEGSDERSALNHFLKGLRASVMTRDSYHELLDRRLSGLERRYGPRPIYEAKPEVKAAELPRLSSLAASLMRLRGT